jgi:hypothetical protein
MVAASLQNHVEFLWSMGHALVTMLVAELAASALTRFPDLSKRLFCTVACQTARFAYNREQDFRSVQRR